MTDYLVMPETGRQIFDLGNVQQAPSNQVIRKYMPLRRFKSLVEMQALYFRRIDKFVDVWDGHIPLAAWDYLGREEQKWYEGCRETTFVWCSSMDEHETRRMWRDYAQDYGICLLSTVGALTGELHHSPPSPCLSIAGFTLGVVEYMDFSKVDVYTWLSEEISNTTPLFRKQSGYTSEFEFRAVLRPGSATSEEAKTSGKIGVLVPVSLTNLIDEVRFFPPGDTRLELEVRNLVNPLHVPVAPADIGYS